MLRITVELLHGTYRADPSGLAPTGQLTEGEWPPSPLRLFAALVAADGTGDRCRITTGEELAFLEHAPPPTIEASVRAETCHQPLLPRYVVEQAGKAVKKAHQEYQGRSGAQVRPGVRVAPRSPVITFRWDVEVPPRVLDGLRARVARVGYLGAADSPVALTVTTEEAAVDGERGVWTHDPSGADTVRVPQPGVLAAMDAHHERWLQEGPSVHRSQSPGLRRLVRYRPPGATPADTTPGPTVIWLAFASPISGRRVTVLTATLKAALLDRYQQTAGEPPPVLHGHVTDPTEVHELALYLALPDVGHRHARGRIHGAAVVLPPSTDEPVVDACRSALHGITELHGPGLAAAVRPWAGDARPLAANPDRWTRPSRRFATAFPALHERRGVPITLTELARWCDHAGLPAPVTARSGRSPVVPGGVDLHPSEVNRPGKPPRPYSHVELELERPVAGPVVIGAGRTRGLGLCAPLSEEHR